MNSINLNIASMILIRHSQFLQHFLEHFFS